MFDNAFFQMVFRVYEMGAVTAFVWGPLVLVWLAQKLWLDYVRLDFIHRSFEFVMLEVKLPRTIDKTPMAMELVLQSLHQGGTGTWYDRWWGGKVKPWFSLEIVSVEGNVKFLIRTPSKFRITCRSLRICTRKMNGVSGDVSLHSPNRIRTR